MSEVFVTFRKGMVSKRDGDRFRGLLLLQCKEFCLGLFIDL